MTTAMICIDYVILIEYTGTFESESHKKSWLLKVGVNECRQLHRQWWRRKVTADESLIDMEKVVCRLAMCGRV